MFFPGQKVTALLIHLAKSVLHALQVREVTAKQTGITLQSISPFQFNPTNQGDTTLRGLHQCNELCGHNVTTVLMDDLLEVVDFKNAIMKMDIQVGGHKKFKNTFDISKKMYQTFVVCLIAGIVPNNLNHFYQNSFQEIILSRMQSTTHVAPCPQKKLKLDLVLKIFLWTK